MFGLAEIVDEEELSAVRDNVSQVLMRKGFEHYDNVGKWVDSKVLNGDLYGRDNELFFLPNFRLDSYTLVSINDPKVRDLAIKAITSEKFCPFSNKGLQKAVNDQSVIFGLFSFFSIYGIGLIVAPHLTYFSAADMFLSSIGGASILSACLPGFKLTIDERVKASKLLKSKKSFQKLTKKGSINLYQGPLAIQKLIDL